MRNFILLLMAFVSMNAFAQHIPGTRTVSTFEVLQGVYDDDGNLLYMGTAINHSRLLVQVTKQYPYDWWSVSEDGKTLHWEAPSQVGFNIAPVFVNGMLLKPGAMYFVDVFEGSIVGVTPFGVNTENMKTVNFKEDPEKTVPICEYGHFIWSKKDAQIVIENNGGWISHKDANSRDFLSNVAELEGPYVKVDGVVFTQEEYEAYFN